MSGVNEVQHESFECKCQLDSIVCNLKQKRNHDECRCECKNYDLSSCQADYMWNPTTCDCECNKV